MITKSKKFILVTLLVVGLLLAFFCISHFFPRDSKDKFTTNTNADFTVVSSNTLKNYQLTNDGQLKKLDSVEVALPEIVDSWFSKGELDKRYLLFSSGDLLESTKDERIVSMDFKTGEIKQNVTSHYAYTGSGYSDEYFYTFQATTTDGALYQFDKSGKETNSYLFNTSTTPSTQFAGNNGNLYLLGTQVSENDENLFENHFFKFTEDSLKLVADVPLDDNPQYIYGFTSITIIGDSLYSPVTAIRDRETYEKTGSNLFMELDLETKEKNFFELPENYPNLIHASKAKEHLLFIHEPTSLGKNGISVVSLKDKTTYFIDVNDILETNDIDEAKILSINTTSQNKLLILTKTSMIVWDMINNNLLSITKEDLSNGIYIWTK